MKKKIPRLPKLPKSSQQVTMVETDQNSNLVLTVHKNKQYIL